jgi:hypothetical protein
MFEGNRVIKGCSVYGYVSNLFMFSKEREYLETSYGNAPSSRFFNLGVNVTF